MSNYDDYDFTPSSSSNLASLFDSSSLNPDTSTLIYTAPKQPKLAEPSDVKTEPAQTTESSVICARVVQVWKLVENKYIPIGKHGLAVIGSSTQKAYEMILYREKRNVIVRIKICQNFKISSKKDDFVSFYDSLKENWLIKFGSSNDMNAVLNKIEMFGAQVVNIAELNENVAQTTQANDVNDHSENPGNTAKADILSRIAKMGQSILPNKNFDTDEHEENLNTVHPNGSTGSTETRNFENQQIIQSPITTSVMQFPQLQSVPNSIILGQSMTYDPLNLYIAENRAQNSEIRINLSQLSDKVNQILKLVDHEKPTADSNSENLKSKIKVLDLRIENLTKEIKMYLKENAQLKQQISDQENLLRSVEQSKNELKRLKEETAKITNLEKQINTYKDNIEDLEKIIQKQNAEIEDLNLQLKDCDNSLELKNELLELKQKLQESDNQERSENLSMSSEEENKKEMVAFVAVLKSSMNEMYGSIISSLDEGKNYESTEISSIIAHNIKSTTLKIIHNFQEVYNKNFKS